MKKLLFLLFLIPLLTTSQTDTISLAQEVVKSIDVAYEHDTKLSELQQIITRAETLFNSKKDKTKTAYVIGNFYYRMATRYNTKPSGATMSKDLGYLNIQQQLHALDQAKKYFTYHINHASKNDDWYRSAKDGLAEIDKKITTLKATE